ncbi:acylcarnitine hydrolase [Biomphalaria glabrata]|nr:acylcarnitine hydrolase-like [Biomphalaria glabrata]KAI8784827.1 acylcarnitine hydrolase [Biomphalaria glabrata]
MRVHKKINSENQAALLSRAAPSLELEKKEKETKRARFSSNKDKGLNSPGTRQAESVMNFTAARCLLIGVIGVLVLQDSEAAPFSTTVVKTRLGPVRGFRELAVNNQSYWSFRGIPYAKPPIGKLRFAKPEPLPYSENVIDATRFRASCPQASMFLAQSETASEDCLFLNVYTKDPASKMKKVLVWIHGGAFLVGSSFLYNPGSIVTSEDIIVVTVNYRLGILGFLSTEDDTSPGNYGLWDQILAIKWVKRNIAAFGGDPNDITIAGESAGGASVSILSISPVSKNLFTKVYSHSGFATSLFADYKNPKSDVITLSKKLGCYQRSSSSQDIIECLRNKPAASLIAELDLYKTSYVPRVDGELLPKLPMNLLTDQKYLHDIGFYDRDYFVALNNNENSVTGQRYYLAKETFYSQPNRTREQKDALWKQFVVTENVADRLKIENPNPNLVDYVSNWYEDRFVGQTGYPLLLTDVNFIIPAYDILNAASQNPLTRVWFLYFNYYPSYMRGSERGMVHALDIAYWFDVSLLSMNAFINAGAVDNFSDTDKELKKVYTSIVADFVQGQVNTNRWPQYEPDEGYYLEFNSHPLVMKQFARDKQNFWRSELPQKLSMISSRCS